MNYKFLFSIFGIVFTLISISNVYSVLAKSDVEISVILDGKTIEFDQPPVIESGRTLVPFRVILEEMGVSVHWNGEEESLTCIDGDKIVYLTIGQKEMFVNDEKVVLDVPAKILNGRTLVPIRAITECFDANVMWDENSKTVEIETHTYYLSANIEAPDEQNVSHNSEKTDTLNNVKNLDTQRLQRVVEMFSSLMQIIGNETYKMDRDTYTKLMNILIEIKGYTENFTGETQEDIDELTEYIEGKVFVLKDFAENNGVDLYNKSDSKSDDKDLEIDIPEDNSKDLEIDIPEDNSKDLEIDIPEDNSKDLEIDIPENNNKDLEIDIPENNMSF